MTTACQKCRGLLVAERPLDFYNARSGAMHQLRVVLHGKPTYPKPCGSTIDLMFAQE